MILLAHLDVAQCPGFDVAPDGRLLVMMPTTVEGNNTEHTLMIVQNFFDELRRRVP
jgi:hypothetical protein